MATYDMIFRVFDTLLPRVREQLPAKERLVHVAIEG